MSVNNTKGGEAEFEDKKSNAAIVVRGTDNRTKQVTRVPHYQRRTRSWRSWNMNSMDSVMYSFHK